MVIPLLPDDSAAPHADPTDLAGAALDELNAAAAALPHDPYTSGQICTEGELAAWLGAEADRRPAIDKAVRGWVTDCQWPSTLNNTDGWLVLLRLRAARDWLRKIRERW